MYPTDNDDTVEYPSLTPVHKKGEITIQQLFEYLQRLVNDHPGIKNYPVMFHEPYEITPCSSVEVDDENGLIIS